jgi:hypothetical protein
MIGVARESGTGWIIVDDGRFCHVSGRRGKSTRIREKNYKAKAFRNVAKCYGLLLLAELLFFHDFLSYL